MSFSFFSEFFQEFSFEVLKKYIQVLRQIVFQLFTKTVQFLQKCLKSLESLRHSSSDSLKRFSKDFYSFVFSNSSRDSCRIFFKDFSGYTEISKFLLDFVEWFLHSFLFVFPQRFFSGILPGLYSCVSSEIPQEILLEVPQEVSQKILRYSFTGWNLLKPFFSDSFRPFRNSF